MNACKEIDRHIAEYMEREGVSVQEMADTLGITTNTFRWRRSGRYEWRFDELKKISEMTGLTLNELTGMEIPA